MNHTRKLSISKISPVGILGTTLLMFVAFPLVANSAPTISNVSGTNEFGNLVTISGSGFGEKQSIFNLQDNSNEYTYTSYGDFLTDLSQTSLWGVEGSPWAVPLETHQHEPTGNHVYVGKAKSYNQWIEPLQGKKNQSIYVSWLFNPSESPSAAEGSNKFIRIWDHSSGGNTRISWTQMHLTYLTNDIGYSPKPSWGHWGGEANVWNHLEIWVDSQNGIIEAHTNGKLIHDVSDFKKSPIEEGLNVKLLGFDPNETARYSTLTFMIDDLYVSTDRARVVVSESASWGQARAIGRPQLVKSWNQKEISFELQPRLDKKADNLYIYVVNAMGEVNSHGVPLCLQCPRPPSISIN